MKKHIYIYILTGVVGFNSTDCGMLKPINANTTSDSSSQAVSTTTSTAPAATSSNPPAAQAASSTVPASTTTSDQKTSTTQTAAQKAGVKDSDLQGATHSKRTIKFFNDTKENAVWAGCAEDACLLTWIAYAAEKEKGLTVEFVSYKKDGSKYSPKEIIQNTKNEFTDNEITIDGDVYIHHIKLAYKNYETVTFNATGSYKGKNRAGAEINEHYNLNERSAGWGYWEIYIHKELQTGKPGHTEEVLVMRLYHIYDKHYKGLLGEKEMKQEKTLVCRKIAYIKDSQVKKDKQEAAKKKKK